MLACHARRREFESRLSRSIYFFFISYTYIVKQQRNNNNLKKALKSMFGSKYIKHTMTVGSGILGAYCAKKGMENAVKLQHAHELALQKRIHEDKMADILLENQGQQTQIVVNKNKTSLFSASEENFWDSSWNSLTNSLDLFIEVTVGSGNEIYLIFCFWLFTLFSLINVKLLQNLFQKEGVFVENPRLASLFIITDKTALFFFLYASVILVYIFYIDCIVLENLRTVGLVTDWATRTSEMFIATNKSLSLIKQTAVLDNNSLNSQIEALINEIGTLTEKVNFLTEKNEELSKQIEELSRKK